MTNVEAVVYTVPEVASLLNVSKDTVYELIRQNRLKCLKMGMAYRIPKKYFDSFIENEINGGN